MKLYYYENGQFEKATGASIFAESNNSNVVQFKLPMVVEGSVVYATFLLPFSQNTDQYGQYKAESLLLSKVVDEEDGGFMYQGTLAEGYLVNNGTAYICARIQAPEGLATYTASSASSITIDDNTYTISYTSTTPAMLKLTDTNSNVFQSLDNRSILVNNAIFLIGKDENNKLTLTTDLIIKATEQVQFKIQAGGGYSATAVLPEFGEQLALAIANIEVDFYNKQDKDTANTDNIITTKTWQTSTVVVTAINNIINQVATNITNIQTNTNNIATNTNDIANIKQIIGTGEDYIGATSGSTLPSDNDLDQFVRDNTLTHREPKGGDVVIFTQTIADDTDKVFKYIYNGTTWISYEIPPIEEAGNGSLGIIEGTYNVGDTSNTLIDIVGGKIKNIYIKDNSNQYRNLVEYSNTTNTRIDSLISGSQTVGKALQAISDGLGNNIVNTYLTQTAGATKQYVRQYALPREFNDIYFISASGYSLTEPTTPASGIQFSLETDSVGDHQIFQISKQETADYELSSKNSARTIIYVAADTACDVQFRLTTQAQISGGAWKTLSIELTEQVSLSEDVITSVGFTGLFSSLGTDVLTISDGDFIRQTLEVVTQTSTPINFDIYSNATYPSSFALNTQAMIIKTISGYLGEEQAVVATGAAVLGGVEYELPINTELHNNTEIELTLTYYDVLSDDDIITLYLNGQEITLETPYTENGGDVLAKYFKQCYYETDNATYTRIRVKAFVKIDGSDNITFIIEEDDLNAIKYGANLSVSGTTLRLKDQEGNNLGSPVTLPETGVIDVDYDNNSVVNNGVAKLYSEVAISDSQPTLYQKLWVDTDEASLTLSDFATANQMNTINSGLTSSDKTKLDGIEAGAEVNTVDSVNAKTGNVVLDATDVLDLSQQAAVNSGIDSTKVGQIATNTSDISAINGKIPAQASSSNQLADKNFVNSSISTNTANFIGTFEDIPHLNAYSGTITNNDYAFVVNSVITDNGSDWATFADLDNYDKDLVTEFDYAWVVNGTKFDLYRFDIINQQWGLRVSNTNKADVTLNTAYNRYKAVVSGGSTTWTYEYTLNNSSFTASQWAAINSGLTSTDKTKLDGIESGAQVNAVTSVNSQTGVVVLTASDVGAEPTISTKNTAFNKNFETSTSNIKMNGTVSVGSLDTIARADHIHPSDTSKQDVIDSSHKLSADLVDDTSTTNKFVTATDISNWNGKQAGLVSGTNIKTINNTTILGSGNIDTLSTSINVLSGTSITLTDNSVNTLTPTGNITFTLPTVTDTTVFHQILIQLNLSTVYTINLGTTTYFNSEMPDLSSVGNYDLIYEYDNSLSAWVVGCLGKGASV